MKEVNETLFVAMGLVFVLTQAALADTFGTGADQFDIDFVTISGATNPTSGISTGGNFTFTGVNNDYRMGTYEITNDQWSKFQAELGMLVTGYPYFAYDDDSDRTETNLPTSEVSWYEAAQFVNWLNTSTGHQAAYKFTGTQGTSGYTLGTWTTADASGGTNIYRHKDAFYYLPTEDEWVKAAYWNGTTLQEYANASPDDLISGDPDPAKWNSFVTGTVPWNVGSGAGELNGTFNMMGNVWEWMESPYYDMDVDTGCLRTRRGGSFGQSGDYLATDGRINTDPYSEFGNLGIRVASEVPEPVSLSLLAIGGLVLIRRRK